MEKIMSNRIFCMILMALVQWNTSAFSGDAVGNGGDPIFIEAVPFPDSGLLNRAADLLRTNVRSTQYSERFKSEFIAEFDKLLAAGRFLYLPGNIIEIPGRINNAYVQLVSLGV